MKTARAQTRECHFAGSVSLNLLTINILRRSPERDDQPEGIASHYPLGHINEYPIHTHATMSAGYSLQTKTFAEVSPQQLCSSFSGILFIWWS